ncbi:MAG TPA: bifunctional glutamate N-acetyltransferase/amino-acid acetyltransferase ArgJ [Acidobacteriaceae bacterium]|nr:bifunctional glutamate N-acetyltransferase/amino-acid acetyltransferase ArgJ [Acidobacteriaceae bacterium]
MAEDRDEVSHATHSIPRGFTWGATRAGIKASGNPDLTVATAPPGATAAVMFTSNLVVAAPIIVGRRHVAATGGRVRTVLVNSGNANCATGEPGIQGCLSTCVAAAETFGCIFDEVLPSSTGIIGVPFPAEKVVAAMPALKAAAGDTPAHAESFARGIMTTDTRLKMASAVIPVNGPASSAQKEVRSEITIWGCAKGAGMIGPKLGPPHATMLVYLFTDVAAEPAQLRSALAAAAEPSFNSISIDGDTSTNDTLLLLASGASGIVLTRELTPAFDDALAQVCHSLARQIVADGEGVTHVVTLDVRGAASNDDARRVARAIAHSPLCKTAWSSGDPNWGRLMAAAGYSGASFSPEQTRIWIGDQPVFEYGLRAPAFDEAAAHAVMTLPEYTITIDLGPGPGTSRFLTCDLTAEYVRINADYST